MADSPEKIHKNSMALLKYLSDNKESTQNRIGKNMMKRCDMGPVPFYKAMYFAVGKGWAVMTRVGPISVYQLTDEGERYLNAHKRKTVPTAPAELVPSPPQFQPPNGERPPTADE